MDTLTLLIVTLLKIIIKHKVLDPLLLLSSACCCVFIAIANVESEGSSTVRVLCVCKHRRFGRCIKADEWTYLLSIAPLGHQGKGHSAALCRLSRASRHRWFAISRPHRKWYIK